MARASSSLRRVFRANGFHAPAEERVQHVPKVMVQQVPARTPAERGERAVDCSLVDREGLMHGMRVCRYHALPSTHVT